MADVLQGLADQILELEELGTDNDFENKTSAVTLTSGAVSDTDSVNKDNKESLMVSKVKDGSKTGRFVPVSETETDEIIKREKNKNTLSKTKSVVKAWLRSTQAEERNPEEIPPTRLDTYLGKFYLGVRKMDGNEYEPDSLTSIQNSIDRDLSENEYGVKIKAGHEFEHSREVLAAKRKYLKKEGKGNKPHKAEPIQ